MDDPATTPRLRGVLEAFCDGADLNEVIAHRDLFPEVLNANGLLGEGAEVGVQHAEFSALLLASWRGRRLWSIDPWRHFGESYEDASNKGQREQDGIFARARARLQPFGPRSRVVRRTSAEAALLFREGQLDFVYIDAQHHYEAVRQDLRLWFPKVRAGGIVAGHDYLDGRFEYGLFGVKRAVDEFARGNGLPVLTTGRFDAAGKYCHPSWFLVKPPEAAPAP